MNNVLPYVVPLREPHLSHESYCKGDLQISLMIKSKLINIYRAPSMYKVLSLVLRVKAKTMEVILALSGQWNGITVHLTQGH